MLKTKLFPIVGVIVAVAIISGVVMSTQQGNNEKNISEPRPNSIKLGTYGQETTQSEIKQMDYKVRTLSEPIAGDLVLSSIKKDIDGKVTLLYSPKHVKYDDDTTMQEFVQQGGIMIFYTDTGANFSVSDRIKSYEAERPGYTFKIHGFPAIGSEKNSDLNVPTQLHIYQDDGKQATLLSWGSVADLVEIAKKLY